MSSTLNKPPIVPNLTDHAHLPTDGEEDDKTLEMKNHKISSVSWIAFSIEYSFVLLLLVVWKVCGFLEHDFWTLYNYIILFMLLVVCVCVCVCVWSAWYLCNY